MNLFLDCEFNEFKGALISLALVSENGREFYEVLDCPNPGPWVKQNVIPILGKTPIRYGEFQHKLQAYLLQFDSINVIADWPEDIKHFCDCLITSPGMRLNTPPLTMAIYRFDAPSELPHNALADARGIAKYFKDLQNEISKKTSHD
jgi:hypothetical protein